MHEGDLENSRLFLVEGDGSLVAAVWVLHVINQPVLKTIKH